MMSQSNEIYRKAAEWSALADSDAFSAQHQAALDAWLAEDLRHLGAYLAVRAALARVARLAGQAQDLNAAREKVVPLPAASSRRRFVLVGAIAASFALMIFSAATWRASSYEAAYATAVGQTKVFSLPDGSSIAMNTASAVSVQYTLLGRNITLKQGEALFDVAKNKLRPFVVTAGKARVRAVGTSFAVTALADRPFQVAVREGVVEVTDSRSPDGVRVSAGARATGRAEGQFVVETLPAGQLARDLAWRDGYIFFRRETLGDAAKEFERYSKLRIVIDDRALASKTVTGRYVSTDPVGFAKAVAMFWDLNVAVNRDGVRLAQKTN